MIMSAKSIASSDQAAVIDRFRLRDLGPIRRLEKASFGAHAFDVTMFLYFAFSRSHRFLVAREQGEMVGYIVVQQSRLGSRMQGHIVSIAVREDRRRCRLGTLLMAGVLEPMRAAGVEEMVLEVGEKNLGAIHLYQNFGFRPDRTLPNFYGTGEHALRMVLTAQTQTFKRESG